MSLVRLSDVFFPPVSCVCVSVLVVGIWCAFTIFELAHWASHGNWFENISKWQMFRKIFWFWICNTNHILIRFQFLNFFNVFKQNEHFDDCNCPGVIHSKLACFFQMLRIELSQRFIFDCVLMVRMSKAFSMKSDWKYLEIGDSNFRICPHNWINVDRSMVRRARGNPTGSVHRSAVIIIIGYWRPQNRKPLNTITTIVGNVDRSSEHVSQTEVKKRQHMKRNAYWRVQRVSWKLIINIYCQSNIIVNLNRRPIFNATFRINVWRPMVRLLRFCFHFIGCRFSDEAAHQARIMQSQSYFCSFCLAHSHLNAFDLQNQFTSSTRDQSDCNDSVPWKPFYSFRFAYSIVHELWLEFSWISVIVGIAFDLIGAIIREKRCNGSKSGRFTTDTTMALVTENSGTFGLLSVIMSLMDGW